MRRQQNAPRIQEQKAQGSSAGCDVEKTPRAEGCSCADALRCLGKGPGIKGEVAVTAAQSAANLLLKGGSWGSCRAGRREK